MKIKIEVPYSHFIVLDADQDAGALLKALANSKLLTSSGYGKETVWKEAEATTKLSFEIVQDSFFVEPHDAIKKLMAENASTTTYWLKANQEKEATKKELDALKAKIDQLGIKFD